MYIYLDTAQVAQFAATPGSGLPADELIKQWNQKKLALCLSLQHLQEIASLADESSRRDRILGLDKIDRLYCSELGWVSIIQIEIVTQLIDKINSEEHKKIPLPKITIWKRTSAGYLLDYIERNIELLRRSRKLNEAACTMQEHYASIEKEMKRHRIKSARRVKDLGKDTKATVQGVVKLIRSTEGCDKVATILKSVSELEEAGSLEKLLGLESVSGIKKRYLSDLDSLSVLFRLGRESIPSLTKITGLTEHAISPYLYKMSVAECHGFMLRMVLLRAIKSSDKKYAPSDWADVNHVIYAPYVDLFYADKRTHHFLEKETREQCFRLEASLIRNIRRILPLEKVIIDI